MTAAGGTIKQLKRNYILISLTSLNGAIVLGCAAYCMFLWHKPLQPTLRIVDAALVCWLYCGTLEIFWGVVAIGSGAMILFLAAAMIWIDLKRSSGGKVDLSVPSGSFPGVRAERFLKVSLFLLGLLTFPAGLLTIGALIFRTNSRVPSGHRE